MLDYLDIIAYISLEVILILTALLLAVTVVNKFRKP